MCVFAVCLPLVGAARTDGKENTKVISDLAAWSDSSWHVGTKIRTTDIILTCNFEKINHSFLALN